MLGTLTAAVPPSAGAGLDPNAPQQALGKRPAQPPHQRILRSNKRGRTVERHNGLDELQRYYVEGKKSISKSSWRISSRITQSTKLRERLPFLRVVSVKSIQISVSINRTGVSR